MPLKILTSKQVLQILSITLAEAKSGSTTKNLLNEIKHFICPLYQAKELTKKVYNNIMHSIKL